MTKKLKLARGQTMVEFAFIMVLLFIFIMGILEFSIIMYNKAILTDACREGAREGVLFRADSNTFAYDPLDAAEVRTVVNNHLMGRLVTFGPPFDPATGISVTWIPGGYPPDHGDEIEVRITLNYRYLALAGFAAVMGSGMGDGTLNLSARSVMRME